MGDGTQLGHASSLHAGQTARRRAPHGTPGQRTLTDNFLTVLPAGCGTLRRVSYAVLQLLIWLLVYLPAGIGGVSLLAAVPRG